MEIYGNSIAEPRIVLSTHGIQEEYMPNINIRRRVLGALGALAVTTSLSLAAVPSADASGCADLIDSGSTPRGSSRKYATVHNRCGHTIKASVSIRARKDPGCKTIAPNTTQRFNIGGVAAWDASSAYEC